MLYRVDNWINEGSGWVIELTDAEYVNISIYSPLSGGSYIELPNKLQNSMKALLNIKNNGKNYFLLCHIRHLNPLNKHSERIAKAGENRFNDLDYEGIKFLVSKNIFARLKMFALVCFVVKKIGLSCSYNRWKVYRLYRFIDDDRWK